MGTRELLILILGLAVVAVILRGLYVALHARRSQIRLAIDKNIPQDLDLEELEMSELPNGGARVIERSLNAVNQQNTLQNELDLGTGPETEDTVPILLDTVEIKNQDEPQQADSVDELAHDEADQLIDSAEGYASDDDERDIAESENFAEQSLEEELFEDDPYIDEVEQPVMEDGSDFMQVNTSDYGNGEAIGHEARLNPELGSDELGEPGDSVETPDGEFDNFSMTAGERIGAPEPSSAGVTGFRSRFGGASHKERTNKDSLFAKFSKKEANSNVDDAEAMSVADSGSDPLFEGYGHSHQAMEEELTPSQSKSPDAVHDIDESWEPDEVADTAGNNEVADINQARESRRPASNGAAIDNSGQPAEPSEVLVVNVMSREGELFYGPDLLQVLITAGLKHGDMNIFHRHLENDSQSPVVFSVANILNPGTFDLDAMEKFATRGVSLFLAMPSVISNRDAFEDMLRTAQQIRAALDGELRDDHRSVMTAQTIEHYRQRINDYELRKLKAAQARS